jgi:hypothetical protein
MIRKVRLANNFVRSSWMLEEVATKLNRRSSDVLLSKKELTQFRWSRSGDEKECNVVELAVIVRLKIKNEGKEELD